MKKFVFCMILSSLLLIPLAANSAPVESTIKDSDGNAYWGGTVVNASSNKYGDVIGSPYFNIDRMVITQDGNAWEIMIYGPYFGHRTTDIDTELPKKLLPGDLYISSKGWEPEVRLDNYQTDIFSEDEGWDYVIPINQYDLNQTYSSGVYALSFANIKTTNVNAPGLNGTYAYRANQAWHDGETGTAQGSANYLFTDQYLRITFDTTALDFSSGMVGFHWTMQCGNDVVRGLIPAADIPSAPEPSTLLLLGIGLSGIAVYKKYRK